MQGAPAGRPEWRNRGSGLYPYLDAKIQAEVPWNRAEMAVIGLAGFCPDSSAFALGRDAGSVGVWLPFSTSCLPRTHLSVYICGNGGDGVGLDELLGRAVAPCGGQAAELVGVGGLNIENAVADHPS